MINQQRISENQKKSGWTTGRDILDLFPSILPPHINNTISKTWRLLKRKHKRGTLWDGDGVCKLVGASQSVIMIHRLHSAGRSACTQKIKHTFLLSCICIYRNLYFELYMHWAKWGCAGGYSGGRECLAGLPTGQGGASIISKVAKSCPHHEHVFLHFSLLCFCFKVYFIQSV